MEMKVRAYEKFIRAEKLKSKETCIDEPKDVKKDKATADASGAKV